MNKFVLTADTREMRSGVTQLLERSAVVQVQFEELAVGDFVLSDAVVVERKAAIDFIQSIIDRRLFGQVAQMKASFEKVIVILEGDIFGTRSQINPDALRGAISWLAVIEGVSLVYTKSVAESAAFLEVMTRHAQDGLGYEIPLRGQKPKNLTLLAQYAVEGLPGIGPGTAKKLLAHFGSAGSVFSASVDELCSVKGVGEKRQCRCEKHLRIKLVRIESLLHP